MIYTVESFSEVTKDSNYLNLLLSGNILYFVSLLLLQELYSSVRSNFDKHSLKVKSVKCL